jgi:hypothetical protein
MKGEHYHIASGRLHAIRDELRGTVALSPDPMRQKGSISGGFE